MGQVGNLMPLVFSHLKYVDNVGPSAPFGSKCLGVLLFGDAEVVGNQQIRLQEGGLFAKPLVKWYWHVSASPSARAQLATVAPVV